MIDVIKNDWFTGDIFIIVWVSLLYKKELMLRRIHLATQTHKHLAS